MIYNGDLAVSKILNAFLKLSPLNKIVESNNNDSYGKTDDGVLNRHILSNCLNKKH